MSENIIEILNTDVVIEIDEASYGLEVENLIVYDYTYSLNKPSINTVSLIGNKTSAELGLASTSEISAKENTENKVAAIDGDSTDTQYPSAKCVYDELSAKANKDLSNLSQTGQAVIDGKADVSLSNLSSVGQKVLDGQWVVASISVASSASFPSSSPTEYSLAEYLPDDGYNYEVIFTAGITTGSTSGNQAYLSMQTDIQTYAMPVCRTQTRSSNSVVDAGSIILPVGTGRTVSVYNFSSNTGTYNLNARAYRRIGTNL